MVSKLMEAKIPETEIIHVTGHKDTRSLKSYNSVSLKRKTEISNLLGKTSSEHPNENQPQITSSEVVHPSTSNINHQIIQSMQPFSQTSLKNKNFNDLSNMSSLFLNSSVSKCNITFNFCNEKKRKRINVIESDSDNSQENQ